MSRNLQISLIVVGALIGVGLIVWAVFRYFPSSEPVPVDANTNTTLTNTNNQGTVSDRQHHSTRGNRVPDVDVDDDGEPLPDDSVVDDQASVPASWTYCGRAVRDLFQPQQLREHHQSRALHVAAASGRTGGLY